MKKIAILVLSAFLLLTGCSSGYTAEDLEQAVDEAYEEGYDNGYEEGHLDGYKEGYDEEALYERYDDGYNVGHRDGWRQGASGGYDAGYKDALNGVDQTEGREYYVEAMEP